MKVISSFESEWSEALQRYVVVAEQSQQYYGPAAEAKGGGHGGVLGGVLGGVAGFMLGGPIGAAIGGGLGSAATGGSLKTDLLMAGGGYLGGNLFESGTLLGGTGGVVGAEGAGAAAAGGAGGLFGGSMLLPSLAVGAAGLMGYSAYEQAQLAKQAQKPSALQPYQQDFAAKTAALVDNPSSVTQTPAYQFQLDQGEQAVKRRMAASGYGGSGNEAIALQNYAQDYAKQSYQSQVQQMADLSMAGYQNNLGTASSALNSSAQMQAAALSNLAVAGTVNQNPAQQ